jgi:hypothetical protein
MLDRLKISKDMQFFSDQKAYFVKDESFLESSGVDMGLFKLCGERVRF